MCEYIRPAPVRVKAGFGGRASLVRVEVLNSSRGTQKAREAKLLVLYVRTSTQTDGDYADRVIFFPPFVVVHRHPKKNKKMQETSRQTKEVLIH